ncbi:radical SAM protein [Hydrogeniiclostridium mannosilyticum]|uniref:radical SAM protein n=1 Tax=Hydrogeniiclostridium mannosilyticum TaxID=2764322 RepID=UPI00399AAC71
MKDVNNIAHLRDTFKNFEPTAYLFPTMRCNLKCQMCYSGSPYFIPTGDELTGDDYCNLVDCLVDSGFTRFDISGGEPLLRPELIVRLAEKINANHARLQLVTNGTLLNTVLSKYSLKPEYFDFIAVSLDSSDEKTYNHIRGGRVYQSVVSGIRELVAQGFHVGLNVVCMDENKYQIGHLLHTAEQLGVCFVHLLRNRQLSPYVDTHNPSFRQDWLNLYEQLPSELSEVPDSLLVLVTLPPYIHHNFTNKLRAHFRGKGNILILTDCIGGCGAFNQNIAITSSGDVTGCVAMINEPELWLGNITQTQLSVLLEQNRTWCDAFGRRSSDLNITPVCGSCFSFRYCKGGCPMMAQKVFSDWRECDISCNAVYDSYNSSRKA